LAFKLIDPKAYHRTRPTRHAGPGTHSESTKNSIEPARKDKDLENTELFLSKLERLVTYCSVSQSYPIRRDFSMFVASEDTGGVVQKFADSGEEDTDAQGEKRDSKKKAVRVKVMRKVNKQEHSVPSVPLMEKGLGDV
jgi:hypothetical protein